jgi:hypothetical protein
MRAFTRALPILFVSSLACGCMQQAAELGDEDPKQPGHVIGFFSIDGTLSEDTCGAASLNAPEKWSFEVKLSRDDGALYWLNGREAIVGDIAEDGRFGFDTHVDVPIAKPRGAFKGCTMVRTDSAKGSLGQSEARLSGTLTYAYSEKSGTDCSEHATGIDGSPVLLPCRLGYSLKGARVSEE